MGSHNLAVDSEEEEEESKWNMNYPQRLEPVVNRQLLNNQVNSRWRNVFAPNEPNLLDRRRDTPPPE